MLKSQRRVKIVYLLLTILLCVFLVGCWSIQELTTLAIALATGVDRTEDGKILLTVQIARPSAFAGGAEGGGGRFPENNVWVVSGTGHTLLDARRQLEQTVSRRIYWGHNVVLLAGEDLAREDIKLAIDFFTRSPIVRETMWILVARGKASEVLNSHSQVETSSAQAIGQMIRTGVGVRVNLKDLALMLASDNNPVLPVVELISAGTAQGPGLKENLPGISLDLQKSPPVHAEVTISGSAVFRRNTMTGLLDMKNTRGVLWITDQVEEGIITIPSPEESEKRISIRLTGASTKVEPHYDGRNVSFNLTIEAEGDIFEQQSAEDLTNPEVIRVMNQKMAEEIKQSVQMALFAAQNEYGLDIFDFRTVFHRKYKYQWPMLKERWDQEFARADVNITVKADIRRSGLVAKGS